MFKGSENICPSFRVLLQLLLMLCLLTMVSAGQNDDSGKKQMDTGILDTLSEQERAWLRDHPVISMTNDPDWPPVDFTDERGEQSGMAMDYLKLVEQQLGMEFQA